MKPILKQILKQTVSILVCILCFSGMVYAKETPDKRFKAIAKTINARDSILIADEYGKIVFSKYADNRLAPASTFKLLTSLAAIHYLGLNYRFRTEFYIDDNLNLKIKGYGDPLLVSEMLPGICKAIRQRLGEHIHLNNLILDDSYFAPFTVPGVSDSLKPYDAANGALSVNFNTLCFKETPTGYEGAEPQTPLIQFAIDKIRTITHPLKKKRINLTNGETTLYAGHLFRYFLEKEGISFSGNMMTGNVEKTDMLLMPHISEFSLEDAIEKLLLSSNNFIANQIFVTIGASVYGQPGTLEKGVSAVSEYARTVLKTENIQVAEGSGIARENQICAKDMLKILEKFKPYRYLMRHEDRVIYKTGTLSDVSTRAGYIEDSGGKKYSFVIFCNTPGKPAHKILAKLLKVLK